MDRSPADVLAECFGGSWRLVSCTDHAVYVSACLVAKVAVRPDGAARLDRGLEAASRCAAVGLAALQPVCGVALQTPLGPVSVWPRVAHLEVCATTLGAAHAELWGAQLAAVGDVVLPDEPVQWEPFARVPYRLGVSTFPPEVLEVAAAFVDEVAAAVPLLGRGSWRTAHGDASVANTLCLPGPQVRLIDFDSAGRRPAGWDLACAWLDLVGVAGNAVAFDAVLTGWSAVREVPPRWGDLVPTKAAMAATAVLLGEPSDSALKLFDARVAAGRRWLDRRR